MSRDLATLADMLLAARAVQELVEDIDESAFVGDMRTRSAVAYQLGIVGEAVGRLSDDFRAAHPEIPWRKITGMRNWLMHQYDSVDWERVWASVGDDLPEVIRVVEQALPPEGRP